ncbi:hypothetical protein [Acetonema longum]|uniref:Uncharacterized protein n=1 Tax=Acetonema longum DSM 6540 TaxID=1009370 RepID=F7NEJ3_9FIRM|nr:hypothetical protein [Acetonema longum]EGO65404.1 hypothetical protein ALO_02281 [Acetonema longum DSM 6540]
MTETERKLLWKCITDAQKTLSGIAGLLSYPETPSDAAMLSLARAGMELTAGMQRQYGLEDQRSHFIKQTVQPDGTVKRCRSGDRGPQKARIE